MKAVFYRIECLTNLHVGSGDVNYNIIDNEVERDPVTGYPIIHASGIKGALRDTIAQTAPELVDAIFGAAGSGDCGRSGTHKFLDARLLARTMRVDDPTGKLASLPVATLSSVRGYLELRQALGVTSENVKLPECLPFGNDAQFLIAPDTAGSSGPVPRVEGEKTALLEDIPGLGALLGGRYAVAKSFDGYNLPVMARNYLENGISKNLWYEEVVPHGSIFFFAVLFPEDAPVLNIPEIVQFGGHASIGCGFCKVTPISGEGTL